MKNIFVGNLDFGATEDSLRALFEQYGVIERVTLIRDRDSGQPRGFGFVEMTDSAAADRAIAALNGANLGGRAINVNEARPRVERAGHGAGGGNRGSSRSRGWREPRR